MIRIESNKTLLNDKELEAIKKKSYEQGVVDGTKIAVGVVLKKVLVLTPENFEEKRKEITDFCMGVLHVGEKGVQQKDGKVGND